MSNKMGYNIALKLRDEISKPVKQINKRFGGLNKNLQQLAGSEADHVKKQKEQVKLLKGLRKNFKEHQATIAKTKAEIADLNAKKKVNGKLTNKQIVQLAKHKDKLKDLNVELRHYKGRMSSVAKPLKKAGINTKNLTKAEHQLANAFDKTSKKVELVNAKLRKTEKIRKRISGIQKKLAIGGAVSLAGGVAAGRAGMSFFDDALEFDEAMSKVQGLTRLDKSSKKLAELRQQAKDLGASTSFTATQVAQGQGFLGMSGFNAQEIQQAMPDMLALSKGSGMDLGETARVSSDMLKAFKLEAKDTGMVADTLAATFTRSNVDLGSLSETMKYVAPIASKAGESIQGVAAMAGLLGDIGVQGGDAGTVMRSLYNRMAAPPKDAQNAIKALNLQISDANGNMRPMAEILADVAEKTKDMGNTKQLAIFKALAGARAGAGLSELVSQGGTGAITKFIQVLKDANGEAQKMAEIMEDNAKGDILKMQSAWSGLSTELFEGSNEGIRETIQSITSLIGKITQWTKENPELAATIVKITGAVTGLAIVFGTLGISVAAMMQLKLLGPVFVGVAAGVKVLGAALIANPIGAILTGIATAGYLLVDNWDSVKTSLLEIWDSIKSFKEYIPGFLLNWFADDDGSLGKQMKQIEKTAKIVKQQSQDLTTKVEMSAKPLTTSATFNANIALKNHTDATATVESVKTTGNPNLKLDVGNYAHAGF